MSLHVDSNVACTNYAKHGRILRNSRVGSQQPRAIVALWANLLASVLRLPYALLRSTQCSDSHPA